MHRIYFNEVEGLTHSLFHGRVSYHLILLSLIRYVPDVKKKKRNLICLYLTIASEPQNICSCLSLYDGQHGNL